MTVREIKEKCHMTVETGAENLDKEVKGCYIGDLLSWAMSRVHEGSLFVTVMGNVNTIAVAVLSNVSAIILSDGAELDDAAKEKAIEQNVIVLYSEDNAYEIASMLVKLGV